MAGGRKSIVRFLVAAGTVPRFQTTQPRIGIHRERQMLEKTKTCVIVTSGGGGVVPPGLGRDVEYEPLAPLIRQGYRPWTGDDGNCLFNPLDLASALVHRWGFDYNKLMREGGTYIYD